MTTAAKIAKLEEALGKGLLTVESDGERVTYPSAEALERAIGYFKRKLAEEVAPGGVARTATTVAVYCAD